MQRRLAAILAADVAGYSRLMEEDEEATVAALATHRSAIERLVARRSGRIFGAAGDSLMVEFASVVEAVRAAIEIQADDAARNADMPPSRHMRFRIGINLGDVMVDGDDLFGDGVNVASRIEKLADTGGVCVSGSVFDQVADKLDLAFTDLGEHEVKNLSKPVRAYRAETGDRSITAREAPAGQPAAGRVSIAVLPFDNMSGDAEQAYFSDGITEDIITELSKFRELRVVAKNAAFHFRDEPSDAAEIARRLGVQFLVRGSVRKAGNRARISIQLIDAASQTHIWGDRYDRDMIEVFEIQDEIIRTIASRVAGQARSSVSRRGRHRPTENLSAYDLYLRARDHVGAYESFPLAEPLLRRAIQIDPSYAAAYALLGSLTCIKYFHSNQSRDLDEALVLGRRALALDPEEPWANYALGLALTFVGRLEEAGHYLDRTIALNPNDATFLAVHALWLNCVGRPDEALREVEEALRRDPYATDWFWEIRGEILIMLKRYRDAIESFRRMKNLPPFCHCYIAICHAELGEKEAGVASLRKYREASPAVTADAYLATEPYADPAIVERVRASLRKLDSDQ